MIYFLISSLAVAGVGTGVFFLLRKLRREALLRSLQLALFSVKIPREATEKSGGSDFKTEINLTEQLLGNLGALGVPFVLEVAVSHVGEEICFYLGVPRRVADSAIKQIQGIWNGATVEDANDDYTIFNPHGVVSGAYLAQRDSFALPFRTYAELGTDTFGAIIGALSKINEIGEGAAIQIVAQPAGDSKKKILQYLKALKKGESFKDATLGASPFKSLEALFDFSSPKEHKEPTLKEEKTIDQEAIAALEQKMKKQLFSVNVRLVASAPTSLLADELLQGLATGFGQFESPTRNEVRVVKPRNPSALVYQYSFRIFDSAKAMILNTEEIASFCHLPTTTTETPRIKWLKSRESPPPSNLPSKGLILGDSVFRGQGKPVFISEEDRRRHLYVVGQTGTGKSTFLGNLAIEDIKNGKGVAVIDPHGDLVESVLRQIPESRMQDLIIFDPGDFERPLGLNMLDFNPERPEEKTFIVNEMQGIFNKLFPPETMGPMFEQYMRNALLLLMEDMANEPATLIEMPRIFTDPEYRKRKLERIHNPVVIDFWTKEAAKAGGDASLANMTPYITSKFNNFIANDYMRPIIGQPKSAFNFREVMDSGKILLINLSKGRIGDLNAGLLGMIFTGKLLMAALSRVDIADQDKRRDFYFYIDEFQNFTTDSISTILSEARKYRLDLTMAHQFIGQLDEKIKDAVFGNVGSRVVFRVGVPDAEFLGKYFAPQFTEKDLTGIDNFNAYVNLLIEGQTSPPFNIKIRKDSWSHGSPEITARFKAYSREKYGRNRTDIEAGIHQRLRT